MQQSNVIFGFLFAAFVVFITSRGELPKYLALFFGPAGGGAPPPPVSGGTSGTPSNVPAPSTSKNQAQLNAERMDELLGGKPSELIQKSVDGIIGNSIGQFITIDGAN